MKQNIILLASGFLILVGCQKYLDVKPDKKLAIPQTLQDAEALMDYTILNYYSGLGETQSDNYYMLEKDWLAFTSERDRNVYTWQNTPIDGDGGGWSRHYSIILTANIVLDVLDKYKPKPSEINEANRIYGSALFFRGYTSGELLRLFSKPYNKGTAGADPGVSIRLSTDMNQKTTRASVAESYQQILADLKRSAAFLPAETSIATRPNKAAAYGAIANVYLSMEDYANASLYADSSLVINKQLIDYNTIPATAQLPFARFNKEVVFHATAGSTHLTTARAKIDAILYDSYHRDDLRKSLFFGQNADKTYVFKGSYDEQNGSIIFVGLTTAEMYLVRGEAYARTNRLTDALKDLNTLMVNRWRKGQFIPFTAVNSEEALKLILEHRRKELVMRNRRFQDLKRLNNDPRFAVTLKRTLGSNIYELLPNDKKYVFPIPQEVIDMTGISQNER